MEVEEIKNCPLCTGPLPISRFGLCRARRDGRNLYCKSCIREKVAAQRKALKEYKAVRKQYQEPVFEFEPQSYSAKSLFKLSPVEKVREALQAGPLTQKQIRAKTNLHIDVIGEVIAELLLWSEEISSRFDGEARQYFLNTVEEKPESQYEPALPFCEVTRKSNQTVVKGEKSIRRVA